MCGIYCSDLSELTADSFGGKIFKLRGPDCLSKIKIEKFHFSHSLLSITGNLRFQPFVQDNIICLYNGEIYNQGDFGNNYESDGECIIDAYKQHGVLFTKFLDGEFALVLYDTIRELIVVSTDVFGTKPLYYTPTKENFGCGSYRTILEEAGHKQVVKMEPNLTRVFSSKNYELIDSHKVFDFALDQYKTSFDDWHGAFSDSIRKRTNNCNKKIFIGLSSGYDSGVICSELLKQKKEFKSYSVMGSEDENIISARQSLIDSSGFAERQSLYKNDSNYNIAHEFIEKNTERYKYNINSKENPFDPWRNCSLIDDSGSNWLSLVCKYARDQDYKVHLSGMGVDEIFSDYGFDGNAYLPHSNFGGLFPDNLKLIFPWKNFYGGSMEAYLTKEEYVGGAYGVETRYPFLDKYVVQEFLSLDKDLKNSYYKSVLYDYLEENRFPFRKDQKLGF